MRASRPHCCTALAHWYGGGGFAIKWREANHRIHPASWASLFPPARRFSTALETLGIGAVGGLLFLWAHLPGGLITGAMIATGIAAIAGRPLAVPPVLTQAVLVVLGISIGSVVSRDLIQHVSAYPFTIAMLAGATFCATFGSSLYLQRVHGWDRTSAFLAGSPGAMGQITILAVERGADLPAIAVVQTMRVIILTAALPMLLALTGVAPASSPGLTLTAAPPWHLVALVSASLAMSLLLQHHEISGELDVRRDDRLQRAAWRRAGRRRRAALGAQRGAGRHRLADRRAVCAHEAARAGRPHQGGARLVRGRDPDHRRLCRHHRADHACAALRRGGGIRAGRDGRHAGAGADLAHRSDLRRRASSVALRVRHASRRPASCICSDAPRTTWTIRARSRSRSNRFSCA